MRIGASVGAAVLIGVTGCGTGTPNQALYDFDGDGVTDAADCGPQDPSIHPGAADFFGDGVDDNCDGVDGNDFDGDGYAGAGGGDCDDTDGSIHPGAIEQPYDGVDDNCDELEVTFAGQVEEVRYFLDVDTGEVGVDDDWQILVSANYRDDDGEILCVAHATAGILEKEFSGSGTSGCSDCSGYLEADLSTVEVGDPEYWADNFGCSLEQASAVMAPTPWQLLGGEEDNTYADFVRIGLIDDGNISDPNSRIIGISDGDSIRFNDVVEVATDNGHTVTHLAHIKDIPGNWIFEQDLLGGTSPTSTGSGWLPAAVLYKETTSDSVTGPGMSGHYGSYSFLYVTEFDGN